MSRKRFLYVGGFQLPDKNAAAHRVITIAKVLNTLGFEVVFLDINESRKDYSLSSEHMEAGYITYSQKRPTGTKRWAEYVLQPLHVEEVLDKYSDWEGVIAYNYPAMALHKLLKICKRRNIKVYADCTEWYQAKLSLSVHDIALMLDSFFRMRVVQKKLDGMIAISSFLGNYYKKHLPTVVIPPLVDKSEKKWEKEENTRLENELKLAYAGSPGKTKDKLDGIIRSIYNSNNKNVGLDVVGITKEEYLTYYPESVKEVDALRHRIIFHGRIPHQEALGIVKNSDYTIFYRDITRVSTAGFPTKFVESISCNVPVITNQTSDLKFYLSNQKNGFMLGTKEFEQELLTILDKQAIEKVECEVEKDVFDYRRYVNRIEKWLKDCN